MQQKNYTPINEFKQTLNKSKKNKESKSKKNKESMLVKYLMNLVKNYY